MNLPVLFLLLSSPIWLCYAALEVDLCNPIYRGGEFSTQEGGVICSEDFRVQAKHIRYIHKEIDGQQIQQLHADTDLLVQYQGRAYVGSEINYDFLSKEGVIRNGKTLSSLWYIGGETLYLHADGGYTACNAFFTTCEHRDSAWDFFAGEVSVSHDGVLEARDVSFRLYQLPAIWLPPFRINVKNPFKQPLVRYSLNWDKGQGPRASLRYQLYATSSFGLYGRFEYRWSTGCGGAIETEYAPKNKKTTFFTKSYLGSDRLENAPDKQRRYRIQGMLRSMSESEHTKAILSWDKYSDVRMPSDFKSEDFEVNPSYRTTLYTYHQSDSLFSSLKILLRANPFESLKQELPTLFFSSRAREIGATGILCSAQIKASYLDFAYSDQLIQPIQDFHAGRFEFSPYLYRPFHLGPLTVTPQAGFIGILYEAQSTKGVALFRYGGKASFRASKIYDQFYHLIEPYCEYIGLTHPNILPSIFSLEDGYRRINQVQLGVSNKFYRTFAEPLLNASVYTNAFFTDKAIPQVFPRLYALLDWSFPSWKFSFRNAWNFRHQLLDFSNSRLQWTVSENIALSLELRYRSAYYWRKADQEDFILDATRRESDLLLSPLSDRRFTILTHAFIRFNPFWECHLQSHHGFLRKNQAPYNEWNINLFAWISSHWKLRLGYTHTETDDRVTLGISLIQPESRSTRNSKEWTIYP